VIKLVVIDGGPCAYKTSVMKGIAKHFGSQVTVVPEVASLLFSGGYPAPLEGAENRNLWLRWFQQSVLPVQIGIENTYKLLAEQRTTRIILCDRGILTGAAYLGISTEQFLQEFGLDRDSVIGRYDMVIHLETIAASNPERYALLKSSNPARYESPEEAVRIDKEIKRAWGDHPNLHVLSSELGPKGIDRVVGRLLSSYLNTEIECKYRLPAVPKVDPAYSQVIRQGYLPTQNEVRIRQMGDEYFITVKGEGTHSREECERLIDSWVFELLWPETSGRQILKERHFYPFKGATLEVDSYQGQLSGLVTMECEFTSKEEMDAFTLPEWAEGAIDVTNDPRYKNKNLAKGDIPE